MKASERIEKLIRTRKSQLPTSEEMDSKVLADSFAAMDEVRQAGNVDSASIWRIIMRSPITKLAAAAVIIVAIIAVHQFGASIDGTTPVYAEIMKSMEKMPWLHATVEGPGERLEGWFSFERRVYFQKHTPKNEIRYQDHLSQTIQVYNADSNTITISHVAGNELGKFGGSVLDMPRYIVMLFEQGGGEVVQKTGKYKGEDAKIYNMRANLGGMDMTVEMVVDIDNELLLYINQKGFNTNGELNIEANAYFDYPESGPDDIYSIGVPISAKIIDVNKPQLVFEQAFENALVVIENRPTWPEPRQLVEAYWQVRAAKNYEEMAILWPGSKSWNQDILPDEPKVEYVFGDAEFTDHGYVYVPYAEKNHYEQTTAYNLKMLLHNRKSDKGRYYIVSSSY